MSDFGSMGEMGAMGETLSDRGRALLPPIVPTADAPPFNQIAPAFIPAKTASSLAVMGQLGDGVFSFFETRILGIPIWVLGLGGAAYYFLVYNKPKKKYRTNPRHDDNADEEYDD